MTFAFSSLFTCYLLGIYNVEVLQNTVASLLMDTSIRQTLRVGPYLSLPPLFDPVDKMDTSLRRTLSAGPKRVRLRES